MATTTRTQSKSPSEQRPTLHRLIESARWKQIHELFRLVDDEWTYEDLELDINLLLNGRVEIIDEDEFEEACDAGHIDDNEADSALGTTKEIVRRMKGREEPFGTHGWDKLATAVALCLQPITTLRHISAM